MAIYGLLQLLLISFLLLKHSQGATIAAGEAFTSLKSDNGLFMLMLEDADELIFGHLVLYHVVDDSKPENNVQLWHSDFRTRNASDAMLTNEGELILYGDKNVTDVIWTAAPNNPNATCKASILELTDTGQLSTKCSDGTKTWIADSVEVYQEDIPLPEPEPCHYLSSSSFASNLTLKRILGLRCLKIRSPKFFFGFGARAISVNDRKCGVEDATDVENSPICFSNGDDKLEPTSTIMHRLRMPKEDYYKDYADVRKKRFKARKLEIEENWNALYWSSSVMTGADFEAVTIMSMESSSEGGVYVEAIVQFGDVISAADYEEEWAKLSKTVNTVGSIGMWQVTNSTTSDPEKCEPLSKSVKFQIPQAIWNETKADEDEELVVGTTIDWACPSGTKLSKDDDGYNAYDDKYTILCTTRSVFQSPKTADWPSCGNSCKRRLPYVPLAKTGLTGVDSENTVPSGQPGKYRCIDTSLGVDAGSSAEFKVQCNEDGHYNVPKKLRDWPICTTKTTTVSPVLPIALRNMMKAFTDRVEFRLEAYAWTGKGMREAPVLENYYVTIVAPTVAVLGVFLICVLCGIRNESPLCKICEEREEDRFHINTM